jgi:hypothetical protein
MSITDGEHVHRKRIGRSWILEWDNSSSPRFHLKHSCISPFGFLGDRSWNIYCSHYPMFQAKKEYERMRQAFELKEKMT